jgi:hypothetical protein
MLNGGNGRIVLKKWVVGADSWLGWGGVIAG